MTDEQRIARYLVDGEEVWSVSKQRQICNAWPITPNYVILTSRRFMVIKPTLTSTKMEDMAWLDINNIHISEELLTATITCQSVNGRILSCSGLEKETALALYRIGQNGEEQMREQRRLRDMEERRSAAANVQIK